MIQNNAAAVQWLEDNYLSNTPVSRHRDFLQLIDGSYCVASLKVVPTGQLNYYLNEHYLHWELINGPE